MSTPDVSTPASVTVITADDSVASNPNGVREVIVPLKVIDETEGSVVDEHAAQQASTQASVIFTCASEGVTATTFLRKPYTVVCQHWQPQGARRQLLEYLDGDQSLHLMARSIVAGLAERHSVVLADQELDTRGEVALAAFPVAMHLFRSLVRAALENADMNWMKAAHRNSYWDLRVSFHAARDASVGDIPVLLVSNDGAMMRAADEVGCRLLLLRLDEYQELVHNGDVNERARLIRAMPSTIDKVPHLVAPKTPAI